MSPATASRESTARSRRRPSILAVTAVAMLALALGASPARASFEWVGLSEGVFASAGTEGELGDGGGLGVNYGCYLHEQEVGHALSVPECEGYDPFDGRVYVAAGFRSRVTVFGSRNNFLQAWGWGVVEQGPDVRGTSTIDEVSVHATGGEFLLTLTIERSGISEAATVTLQHNASAAQVQEALNTLPLVEAAGASVAVSGGPGDAGATAPYVVTLEGSLTGRPMGHELHGESDKANPLTGGSPSSSVGISVSVEGAPAYEICAPSNGDRCLGRGRSGEGTGQFGGPAGVAVDQATGDVYVLDAGRENGVVQIFSAAGEYLSSFGARGGQDKPTSENPDLIRSAHASGIAIDQATGNVYVVDHNNAIQTEGRVMVFTPVTPGSLAYEYEKEFAVGDFPEEVAVDASGHVYVTGSQRFVYRFAAGNLATPEWLHEDNKELDGMTVDPAENGDVFYYTDQNRRFHELKSAEELETGGQALGQEWKGVEIGSGQENRTLGLAFNPGLMWEAGSPAGVLYAIDTTLAVGLIWTQPAVFEPSVEGESVSRVGSGAALLGASINAHGVDTRYRFQYGGEDCAEHACGEVPSPSAGDAGSGGGAVSVAASLTGLLPGTEYHFRVLAESLCHPPPEQLVECVVAGPDRVFRTFTSSSGFADGRVFELVSPPVKNGGEVFPLSPSTANCELCMPGVDKDQFPRQSTVDGDSIVYEGDPFAASGDAVSENEYLSRRGAGGAWGAAADLSPALAGKALAQGYKAFSADLSKGVLFEVEQSFEGAPSGYPDLYLKNTVDGSLQPLVREAPSNVTRQSLGFSLAGASADFSHIIFQSNGVFATESGVSTPAGGGLYEWAGGSLRLVNILPGETAEPGAAFGSGASNSHAISADGSRVFWTDTNSGPHTGRLYVRVNGEKTLEVPADGEGGAFLTASPDGTRVLLSDGRIYDVGDEVVVEEPGPISQEGHEHFQGILGSSDDLSSVYFIDTAALTGSEENAQGAKAEAGKYNLYLSHDGTVKFLATLAATDNETDLNISEGGNTGDWAASPSRRTAESTLDGRFVTFMSKANLLGGTGGEGFQVYEYDASTERLACASCNPTGEQPLGPSTLGVLHPQNLAVNGRVFFDSYDQLSPQDTNGAFEDVYQYEPDSIGSCTQPQGCVSLISSGQQETNSSFINATPSGSDVFFTTRSQLVPEDQDELSDLYDARVNGTPPPPKPTPCTTSETCHAPTTPPPLLQTLPSLNSTPSGNLTPPPPTTPPPPPHKPTIKQLLVKALHNCHKHKHKRTRHTCEKHARQQYGAKATTKKSTRRSK